MKIVRKFNEDGTYTDEIVEGPRAALSQNVEGQDRRTTAPTTQRAVDEILDAPEMDRAADNGFVHGEYYTGVLDETNDEVGEKYVADKEENNNEEVLEK